MFETIDNQILKYLKKAIISTSTDELRAILTGVLLKCENKTLYIVSTDASILYEAKINDFNSNDFNVVLSKEDVGEIVKSKKFITNFNIVENVIKQYASYNPSVVVSTRETKSIIINSKEYIGISGNYPNYKAIVPVNTKNNYNIKTLNFINYCGRNIILNNGKMFKHKLHRCYTRILGGFFNTNNIKILKSLVSDKNNKMFTITTPATKRNLLKIVLNENETIVCSGIECNDWKSTILSDYLVATKDLFYGLTSMNETITENLYTENDMLQIKMCNNLIEITKQYKCINKVFKLVLKEFKYECSYNKRNRFIGENIKDFSCRLLTFVYNKLYKPNENKLLLLNKNIIALYCDKNLTENELNYIASLPQAKHLFPLIKNRYEELENDRILSEKRAIEREQEKVRLENEKIDDLNKQIEVAKIDFLNKNQISNVMFKELCLRYSVSIPLRTLGWVINSLIKIDCAGSGRYYGRYSQKIEDIAKELYNKLLESK